MEISRDALLRIVKAVRMSMKMSCDIRGLCGQETDNEADRIQGLLEDVLYEVVDGRELGVKEDLANTEMYRLLEDMDLNCVAVTDGLVKLYERNHPAQPKPNLINRNQFGAMLKRYGGYKASTAEGEWK